MVLSDYSDRVHHSDVKRFKKTFFTGKKSDSFFTASGKLKFLQFTSGAACNKEAFEFDFYVKWQN